MVVTVAEILILRTLQDSPKSLGLIYDKIISYGCTISYSDTYVKLRQLKFEKKVSNKFRQDYYLTEEGLKTLNSQITILASALLVKDLSEK